MKATARCPKCGKKLGTSCTACITGGKSVHKCKGSKEVEAISGIKWNITDKRPGNDADMSFLKDLKELQKIDKDDKQEAYPKTIKKKKS